MRNATGYSTVWCTYRYNVSSPVNIITFITQHDHACNPMQAPRRHVALCVHACIASELVHDHGSSIECNWLRVSTLAYILTHSKYIPQCRVLCMHVTRLPTATARKHTPHTRVAMKIYLHTHEAAWFLQTLKPQRLLLMMRTRGCIQF
jgi:hypothetical protein